MKQIFIIFFITSSFNSFSQIKKGSILAGASLSFNGSKFDESFAYTDFNGDVVYNSWEVKNTYGYVSLNYGVFSNASTLWGASVGYNYDNNTSEVPASNSNSNTLSFGVNLRKYRKLHEKWYFTLNLKPRAGFTRTKGGDQYQFKSSAITYNIGIAPGLTYFINSQWILSSELGSLFYEIKHTKQLSIPGEPVLDYQEYGLSLQANTFSVSVYYLLKNGNN